MVYFITVLRAVAACLITNSHYTGVYPSDIIANGGLIGDILFFAVSGYCLFNVRHNFFHWYGKRLIRVYIPVVLITVIYLILGFYTFNDANFVAWFIYPTAYHFVASILLLYIPFWFVGKLKWIRNNLGKFILVVTALHLLVYIIFYDKSYYHIDNVREWMIRFLFFESMLIGAFFRKNKENFYNKFYWYIPVITIVLFAFYFASKIFFTKYAKYSYLQIINQALILVLLFFMFWLFSSLDAKLVCLPKLFKITINFIAKITLEIYVVQSVIINLLRQHMVFPLNWLAITTSIIVSAYLLHLISQVVLRTISLCVARVSTVIKKTMEKNK